MFGDGGCVGCTEEHGYRGIIYTPYGAVRNYCSTMTRYPRRGGKGGAAGVEPPMYIGEKELTRDY